MNKQLWPAPAKLNLMLHITGRREDGYHELQTVFQFIDFADALEFKLRSDGQITRHCEDFEVPEQEDIIIRAANLLREKFQQNNPSLDKKTGVDIILTKKYPDGCRSGWRQFGRGHHINCVKRNMGYAVNHRRAR